MNACGDVDPASVLHLAWTMFIGFSLARPAFVAPSRSHERTARYSVMFCSASESHQEVELHPKNPFAGVRDWGLFYGVLRLHQFQMF